MAIRKIFLIVAMAVLPVHATSFPEGETTKTSAEQEELREKYGSNAGEIQDEGEKYEGQLNEKGLKDGIGKFVWVDVCDGNWKNDKMEGKGKIIYVNGNVYEGDWKNDVM
jgi:hypothetical protein